MMLLSTVVDESEEAITRERQGIADGLALAAPAAREADRVGDGHHADADGQNIRPGIARLAAMTGKDPRTVQRDVSALIKKNLLVPLTPRRGHGGRPTHYELNVDVLALLGRTSQDDPESHDEQGPLNDDRRERLATTTLASPDVTRMSPDPS